MPVDVEVFACVNGKSVFTDVQQFTQVNRQPAFRAFETDICRRVKFMANAPPALADSVLAEMAPRRPGWGRLHELRALVAVRLGSCERAAEQFIALIDFGLARADAPMLVQRCRENALRGG